MPYQLLHNNMIIWNMEDADEGEEDEGRAHVPIVVQRIQRYDWRMSDVRQFREERLRRDGRIVSTKAWRRYHC
jgi:hypothetical protein